MLEEWWSTAMLSVLLSSWQSRSFKILHLRQIFSINSAYFQQPFPSFKYFQIDRIIFFFFHSFQQSVNFVIFNLWEQGAVDHEFDFLSGQTKYNNSMYSFSNQILWQYVRHFTPIMQQLGVRAHTSWLGDVKMCHSWAKYICLPVNC